MGLNPRNVHHEDSEGRSLRILPVSGKIVLGITGHTSNTFQAVSPISPIRLIGMIQEAAGLESSDPDSWTYRTQAFEWALEKTGGDADAAIRVAQFIADGDVPVR